MQAARSPWAAGDHWGPGPNSALTKPCNEWVEKCHVEEDIDDITGLPIACRGRKTQRGISPPPGSETCRSESACAKNVLECEYDMETQKADTDADLARGVAWADSRPCCSGPKTSAQAAQKAQV